MADNLRRPYLLLVEDEVNLARTISFNLEQEGYRVDQAHFLSAARLHLPRVTYDLVVLDVMLPDGSGLDFLRELRAAGNHTPILVLTARTATTDVVHGLRTGADDYLGKPFALDELLSRIAALLRRQAWVDKTPENARMAVFGDNRIDLDTGTAETRHGTVQLTETELRLLRYFVHHRGEDLPRQRLLAEVWDLAVADGASSRTLDNFVLCLRRHLETDPAKPVHFRTVYGTGYRFHPGEGGSFTR